MMKQVLRLLRSHAINNFFLPHKLVFYQHGSRCQAIFCYYMVW
jgi:hypothetical protein